MRALFFFLMLAVLSLAARAADEARPGAPAPAVPLASEGLFLITDYVPPAWYDGDALTLCFRAENAGKAERSASIRCTLLDAAGGELQHEDQDAPIPPGATRAFQFNLDVRNAAGVRVTMKDQRNAPLEVRICAAADAWPAIAFKNGRATADGAVVVLKVSKRMIRQDRAYAVLRWFNGQAKPAPGVSVALAPAAWLDAPSGSVHGLGGAPRDGSLPILRAAFQIENLARGVKTGPFIIAAALPPEDLELATDPRTYRLILDGLLERLEQLAARAVLLPPVFPGTPDAIRERLWREVDGAAAAYKARVESPVALLSDEAWRVGASSNVLGSRPAAEARKKFEQALRDLLN